MNGKKARELRRFARVYYLQNQGRLDAAFTTWQHIYKNMKSNYKKAKRNGDV